MINTTLLWLLMLPIICGIVVFYLRRSYDNAIQFSAIFAVVGVIAVLAGFYISKGAKTSDIEIWNGQVVSKSRVHDSYVRSYQCNCTTSRDSNGNTTTSCQTCYEDHYTVEWSCDSTIGKFQIKKLDETSQSVYRTPDPRRYTVIEKGDPVARQHSYTNYIQAVPNSLFSPAPTDLKKQFKKLIPKYPDDVYDYYKLDRFITPGYAMADTAQWNNDISNGLRELGPRKQVNAIIVVAKTSDPNYEYALRDAWEGVNKNDVVLLIGSAEYPKIDFVRVISWTKNETFKIELRDAVMEKGVVDRSVVTIMLDQIGKNFERRHMKEFAYLDSEIDPPEWLVIILMVLVIGGAGGVWFFIPQYGNGLMADGRRYRRF